MLIELGASRRVKVLNLLDDPRSVLKLVQIKR